jgi:hypothetical protein
VIALSAMHSYIVVQLINYISVDTVPAYAAPLGLSETTSRALVDFGLRSESQHLVVELPGPDIEPIAYLVRPFFPRVEIFNEGGLSQVGLGHPIGPPQASADTQPVQALVGPLARLDLTYPDSVEVLSAQSPAHAAPGQRVGLAMAWVVNDPSRAIHDGVVWELELDDATGRELAREPGAPHDLAAISSGETIVSWLTLGTPVEPAPGPYRLRLRRLERQSHRMLPFLDTVGQTSTDWQSDPIDIAQP